MDESGYVTGLDKFAGSRCHQKIETHVGCDSYKMKTFTGVNIIVLLTSLTLHGGPIKADSLVSSGSVHD